MCFRTSLAVTLLVSTVSCGSSDRDPISPPPGAGGSADAAMSGAGGAPGAGAGGAPSGGTGGGGASVGGGTASVGGSGAGGTWGGTAGLAGTSAGVAGGSAGGGWGTGGAAGSVDPGTEGDGDFIVTDFTPPAGVPGAPDGFFSEGDIDVGGSDLASGNHEVQVFIPRQYVDGTEAPFMVVADGIPGIGGSILRDTVRSRAAATDERRVPPLVLIGVRPGSNRNVEYDTVSDRYLRFIKMAVLPAVLQAPVIKSRYPDFKLTTKPEGRGVFGCSSGGTAALGMAWFGDFTRVMSFSGSFVSLRTSPQYPSGAWEYPRVIEEAPLKTGLRVFLHVGERDNGFDDDGTSNWVEGNQNLAAALKDRGYHYRFVTAQGSGHCEGRDMRAILPDALTWLWRGYVSQ